MRYLENRGIIPATPRHVWAFVGDGETDEPETLGALTLASREKLDNLIFVVNCNLQRLDGPVRGNGSIIQELEGSFRGAGWNVIKVIWGSDWDELFARDKTGLLLRRMEECVDGEYQSMKARGGKALREEFFGKYPELRQLVEDKTDDQLMLLKRGGHDPVKVYNGYKRAVDHRGGPTVILAKTIKGYGMGEAGEGRNVTHQQKKLNEDELLYIKNRFNIPISDEAVHAIGFYKPEEESAELKYMRERRKAMGGPVPSRQDESNASRCTKAGSIPRGVGRIQRTRGVNDFRIRGSLEEPDEGARTEQVRWCRSSSDEARTLRYGIDVPRIRYLRQPRPVVQTGRQQRAAAITRKTRRARSSKKASTKPVRCRPSRQRRDRLCQPRRADDSAVHLLLDVWLSANWRFDLGLRGFPRQRISARRHRRPHRLSAGRGFAAPRTVTAWWTLEHSSDPVQLRSGIRLRNRGHHPGMASGAGCTRRWKTGSITSLSVMRTTLSHPCRRPPGLAGIHPQRPL